MKWFEASSVEDLKKLGKLKTVKEIINKDIRGVIGRQKNLDTFIKMGSNSWKGLFDKIQDLKKIGVIVTEGELDGQAISSLSSDYFLNESSKYIYYLLELEGETRMKKLGITRKHYRRKDIAKDWYHDIAKKIHPDKNNTEKAEKAMAELNSIYNKMIDNG